jgi:anaerobic magnesium-protoporphyrin IX monomethyl ester cyclase
VLVRIPVMVSRWDIAMIINPPIGLAYIAASLRAAGHDVRCVDATGEAPLQKNIVRSPDIYSIGLTSDQITERVGSADIIGVSVGFSNTWPFAKQIIKNLRKQNPKALIVCGGEHITAVPEFCLTDCPEIDICVLGEGEETMVAIATAHKNGETFNQISGICYVQSGSIVSNSRRSRIKNIDAIPWPAWDLLPLENYLANGLGYGINPGRTVPILATRGCPYRCTFCSSPNMWTTRWQARNAQSVLDEIEFYIKNHGAQNIDFYDLTTVIRKDWIIEFCQGILARGIKVSWQMPSGTRSEALDSEVLDLMNRAGVKHLTYAPESGSNKTLKEIKKKVSLEKMTSSMRAAIRLDMNVKLNMIVGFPQQSRKEIYETLIFLLKMAWIGVSDVILNTFMPYPGSELFKKLYEKNQIRNSSTGLQILKLNDAYFWELIQTAGKKFPSNSESISNSELALYRFIGMVSFYSLSFILRPFRFLKLIYNLAFGIEATRLQASLLQMRKRNLGF